MAAKKPSRPRPPKDILEELAWAFEDLRLVALDDPYMPLLLDSARAIRLLMDQVLDENKRGKERLKEYKENFRIEGPYNVLRTYETHRPSYIWTVPEILEHIKKLEKDLSEAKRQDAFILGEESGRKIFNDRMEALEAEHELRCGALMEQVNQAKKAATVVHHGRMLTAESMARELAEKDAQIASLKAKYERILQELNQQGKQEQADHELRDLVQCRQVFAMATLATNAEPAEDDRCLHVDVGPNGTTGQTAYRSGEGSGHSLREDLAMPLKKSASTAAVGENIRAEKKAGKSQAQAVAIALSVQREAKKKAAKRKKTK